MPFCCGKAALALGLSEVAQGPRRASPALLSHSAGQVLVALPYELLAWQQKQHGDASEPPMPLVSTLKIL